MFFIKDSQIMDLLLIREQIPHRAKISARLQTSVTTKNCDTKLSGNRKQAFRSVSSPANCSRKAST